MFQEITPHRYHCCYAPRKEKPQDYLFFSQGTKVMLKQTEETFDFFCVAERERVLGKDCALQYLFSIDETAFYLPANTAHITPGQTVEMFEQNTLRRRMSGYKSFAGVTALHLSRWYDTHRYCGHCGETMVHKSDERAMMCKKCGNIVYPQISPVIIAGVMHNEQLLLTRYAKGQTPYRRHALIAGFVEIGESIEDSVRREVMEEVGLKIKNIRYYASQPWGFSGTVLMGFFAQAEEPYTIHMDQRELSEAKWFHRDEIPHDDNTYSLTWDMIEAFRSKTMQAARWPENHTD